jgi:hypothetical protein
MKVRLRNPDREVQLEGGRPLSSVLDELGVAVDTVLVRPNDREVANELADEVLPVEIYDGARR